MSHYLHAINEKNVYLKYVFVALSGEQGDFGAFAFKNRIGSWTENETSDNSRKISPAYQ